MVDDALIEPISGEELGEAGFGGTVLDATPLAAGRGAAGVVERMADAGLGDAGAGNDAIAAVGDGDVFAAGAFAAGLFTPVAFGAVFFATVLLEDFFAFEDFAFDFTDFVLADFVLADFVFTDFAFADFLAVFLAPAPFVAFLAPAPFFAFLAPLPLDAIVSFFAFLAFFSFLSFLPFLDFFVFAMAGSSIKSCKELAYRRALRAPILDALSTKLQTKMFGALRGRRVSPVALRKRARSGTAGRPIKQFDRMQHRQIDAGGDLDDTADVSGGDNICINRLNLLDFPIFQPVGERRLEKVVRARRSAANVPFWNIFDLETELRQERFRLARHLLAVLERARRMIGDGQSRGALRLETKTRQILGDVLGERSDSRSFGRIARISAEQIGVVLHHGSTAGGGHHNGVEPLALDLLHPRIDVRSDLIEGIAIAAHVMDQRTAARFVLRPNDLDTVPSQQPHRRLVDRGRQHRANASAQEGDASAALSLRRKDVARSVEASQRRRPGSEGQHRRKAPPTE